MEMIFGIGGLRVEMDGAALEIPLAETREKWEDEYDEVKVLSGRTERWFLGSRVKIHVVLQNVADESSVILSLMRRLNDCRANNSGLMVYANYMGPGSRGYLCHPPSKWDPDWLSNVGGGQKIEIDFESIALEPGVPAWSSPVTGVQWTTHSGAVMMDHSGDVIVFNV